MALAEKHQYLRELALGWKLEGELAAASGRLRDAQEFYDRAEAIAAHIAPDGDLVTELSRLRAEQAIALGEAPAALDAARRALALAGRQGDVYEEAMALAVLARAYDLAGEPGRAHQAHVQATDRLRELGARYPLAWALVAAAAHLRAASPERNQARLYLREARSRLEECGDPLGPSLVGLEGARLEIAAGHLDQAVEMLGETAPALRASGRPRDIELLGIAERELEEALVSQALAARRVTHRARGDETNDLVTPERLRHTLSSVVDALRGNTAADGILLAIRQDGSGPVEPAGARRHPGDLGQGARSSHPGGGSRRPWPAGLRSWCSMPPGPAPSRCPAERNAARSPRSSWSRCAWREACRGSCTSTAWRAPTG